MWDACVLFGGVLFGFLLGCCHVVAAWRLELFMYLVSWFVSYEDTIGGVGFLVRVGCMVFLLWVLMFG